MKHTIEVENIKCGGCTTTILTALSKISGVSSVEIDKGSESITIDSETGRSILVDTLSGLGYPEKGENTLLKKAKSYISCAIGRINA